MPYTRETSPEAASLPSGAEPPATRQAPPAADLLPSASILDTLRVLFGVFTPAIAKGVIIRRPQVLALAELLDADRRAVRRMQRLRHKYGSGPLLLRIPGRSIALILDPAGLHRVLAETPEPFASASAEKRAALAHFEPKGALISHGPERAVRRRYNEEALQAGHPVHRLAETFLDVIDDEASRLHVATRHRGQLTWDDFAPAWFRVVRRVVFGDSARSDHEVTEMMAGLRVAGNWAFLRPQRTETRDRLLARIRHYLHRAEPGSLAGFMADIHVTEITAPEHQVPQWLFAFDPAGMAAFRALALLATHPDHARRARNEIDSRTGSDRQYMPFLRATVLESLRLWPTTPLVLRESTAPTSWPAGIMPANTAVVIFAPYFHRDNESLPFADRFEPEIWLEDRNVHTTQTRWPLVPFSEGPAVCPGRHLVLLLTSAMLAEILTRSRVRLQTPTRLRAGRPLPGTLSHFHLRFDIRERE